MRSAWRMRCPKGHSTLAGREGDYYMCKSCGVKYSGEPLDAARHEFPVDDVEERRLGATPHELEVLGALVRESDCVYGVKARELPVGTPSAAGRRLGQLRDKGLVEKKERTNAAYWAPTESGRRLGGGRV